MALIADTSTPRRPGVQYLHPLAASVKAFTGGIAVLDALGNVKPAVTATGLIACGIFQETVDNLLGGAGDKHARIETGVFGIPTDGSINRGHIGETIYLVDDNTVTATSGGTRSAAGVLDDFDGTLAWVRFGALIKGDQGDKGDTGATGKSFLAAAGAPASGTGANGDVYLNLTNGDLYGPKAAGAWGAKVATLTLA